ncbi:hypothetical protein H4R35_005080 [Dimargaris xerosporica]|nr:hypothetical protein H4R35_005080 [Dimargaris xerosporica]
MATTPPDPHDAAAPTEPVAKAVIPSDRLISLALCADSAALIQLVQHPPVSEKRKQLYSALLERYTALEDTPE